MTNYCGYMGRVALLDLSGRRAEDYLWTDPDREKYIGGKAMASKILYDNLTGKETAFDPENLIVVAIGPAGENLVRYASVMSGERAKLRDGDVVSFFPTAMGG